MKKRAIVGLLITYLGACLGFFLLGLLNRFVWPSVPRAVRAPAVILVYWLPALPAISVMVRTGLSVGLTAKHLFRRILTGILIGLAMSLVFTLLPMLLGAKEWVSDGTGYTEPWQFLYQFVYCIFAVGAAEELIFRGVILTELQVLFRHDRAVILLSAALFGLIHAVNGGLAAVPGTFLLGIVFALLRKKLPGASLLSLMLAHGVYDALITVWSFVFR